MTQWATLVGERLSVELGSEDSTVLYTSARRAEAVLEGEREFCELTECLTRQTTISCSNGVGEYDLNSTVNIAANDFSYVGAQQPEYRFVSSNSTAAGSTQHVAGPLDFPRTDVERLNREDPGWRDSTGSETPTSWYLRQDGGQTFLGIVPPPSVGSSETGAVVFPYVAQPTQTTISTGTTAEPFTLNSQVRTDLRPYHQALVHYGAHVLFKARRDDESSDRQLQKFLGYVTRFLQQRRPRGGQRVSVRRQYFREASRQWSTDRRYLDPRRY